MAYWWSSGVQLQGRQKTLTSRNRNRLPWWASIDRAKNIKSGHYDFIVVGGGLMGSASAYYLAKAGKSVLLLEQFEFGHSKGSSYGESRVIRREYKDPPLSEMIDAAYTLWEEVQAEAGEQVIHQTGSLDIAPDRNSPDLEKTLSIIRAHNIEHEILSGKEVKERWPVYQGLPDHYTAVYQPHSGIGEISAAVQMFLNLARSYGATILDKTPVEKLTTPSKDTVSVHTARGVAYTGRGVVVCTGPWSSQQPHHLLGKAGIGSEFVVDKLSTAYYRPLDASAAKARELSQMPWFLLFEHPMCYGVGPAPGPRGTGLLKIGPFWCDESNAAPETRTFDSHKETIAKLDGQARFLFGRELVTPAAKKWTCLVSRSADGMFVIDQPDPRITVANSMSGHGFKFGPVIGQICADLAIKHKSQFDLSPFKLGRNSSGPGHVFAELFNADKTS